MKKIFLALSIFCFFFACKKEDVKPNSTPVVKGKDLECYGQIFDYETGKPLEGVTIIRSRFFNTRDIFNFTDANANAATTDKDGKYKFTFFAKDSITYLLTPEKSDYLEFNGSWSCSSCSHFITPYYSGSPYNLTDTFYMAKAGMLNVKFNLGKTPINDTLFLKKYQMYNGKKIGHDYASPSNFTNYTPVSNDFKILADRMTYLSWKLKSEKDWHQDSIFTPYNKTVNFEIKY